MRPHPHPTAQSAVLPAAAVPHPLFRPRFGISRLASSARTCVHDSQSAHMITWYRNFLPWTGASTTTDAGIERSPAGGVSIDQLGITFAIRNLDLYADPSRELSCFV